MRGRKDVAVVGAGSSAVNLAALMHQAGAIVELIGRRKELVFHAPPTERSLVERLKTPRSLLGVGWRSVAAAELPQVFYSMQADFRLRVVRSFGPATGWFVRELVENKFPVHLGTTLEAAEAHRRRSPPQDRPERRLAHDRRRARRGRYRLPDVVAPVQVPGGGSAVESTPSMRRPG